MYAFLVHDSLLIEFSHILLSSPYPFPLTGCSMFQQPLSSLPLTSLFLLSGFIKCAVLLTNLSHTRCPVFLRGQLTHQSPWQSNIVCYLCSEEITCQAEGVEAICQTACWLYTETCVLWCFFTQSFFTLYTHSGKKKKKACFLHCEQTFCLKNIHILYTFKCAYPFYKNKVKPTIAASLSSFQIFPAIVFTYTLGISLQIYIPWTILACSS